MKARGKKLRFGRIRQEVAGELLDREPVERQVAVERVDHVVAIFPDAARLVVGVTLGVGVTREIQPRQRPMLAISRLGQLPVDETLVGGRAAVHDEGVDFLDRGRQAGEIQRHAARQSRPVGLGLRAQAFFL